ncbi:PGAP2-interacting protein [Parasponia andersonii]|uniref:PGAP2-interacting protein n=1 Tax=Parasponia andersonii TaxID=3476 RepID=A0A2P5E3X3_PARAD|nr:PGAP2-interacting protein [Parasponia andersonii]
MSMQSPKLQKIFCNNQSSNMLSIFRRKFKRLCSRIRRLLWGRPRPKVVIRRLGKWNSEGQPKRINSTKIVRNGQLGHSFSKRSIRIATFNVAMFSLAPAISKVDTLSAPNKHENDEFALRTPSMIDIHPKSANDRPKSILKSPLSTTPASPECLTLQRKLSRSNLKVSINLPDNEISLANNKLLTLMEADKHFSSNTTTGQGNNRSSVPVRSPLCFPPSMTHCWNWYDIDGLNSSRSILEVLREVDADILALQDVKAEEEKGMKPLSTLAAALGMKYVFAESWAPEYGNAILSKWPIKRWKVQKIANNDDFRNVLKATIDVPWAGEVNFYCTQLDHLDENWRMKQISALFQANDPPHILAGGLNSLNGSDYSSERWTDIVKYYEDMGKPTPKVEVMKFLKGKGYTDAKDYAGECEPVVIIAKGQNVQGTSKYGTRVDYVLSSSESPYKFVPGSYSVVSSKGTSDHHMVKVDIVKERKPIVKENVIKRHQKSMQKLVSVTSSGCSSRAIRRIDT